MDLKRTTSFTILWLALNSFEKKPMLNEYSCQSLTPLTETYCTQLAFEYRKKRGLTIYFSYLCTDLRRLELSFKL